MTHTIAIYRSFATRASSAIGEADIGEVRLTGEASLSLDGKPLPAKSVEYLCNFALQSLQDAYAGKDNPADAIAAWTAKRDALIDGSIGTRGPSASVPTETRIAREIMRGIFMVKASADARKEYKDADADGRAAILDAAIAKNEKAIAKLVKEQMAIRANAAETAIEL